MGWGGGEGERECSVAVGWCRVRCERGELGSHKYLVHLGHLVECHAHTPRYRQPRALRSVNCQSCARKTGSGCVQVRRRRQSPARRSERRRRARWQARGRGRLARAGRENTKELTLARRAPSARGCRAAQTTHLLIDEVDLHRHVVHARGRRRKSPTHHRWSRHHRARRTPHERGHGQTHGLRVPVDPSNSRRTSRPIGVLAKRSRSR